jgi:hypothetical protein
MNVKQNVIMVFMHLNKFAKNVHLNVKLALSHQIIAQIVI